MPLAHNMLGNIPTDTERTFVTLADDTSGTRSCSVYENILNPGAVVPWQSHPVEEVIVCLSGEGECTFSGGEPQQYRAGSVLVISANTRHAQECRFGPAASDRRSGRRVARHPLDRARRQRCQGGAARLGDARICSLRLSP
jgi:uncharacterized cupin superfamily protein